MTKAPGSGSGPSPVAGRPEWSRPGAALLVVVVALVADAAIVLNWSTLKPGLGPLPDAVGALLDIVVVAGPLLIGALVAARLGGPGIRRALGLRVTALDLALGFFVALLARAVMELIFPTVGGLVSAFADDDRTAVLVVTIVGAVLIAPVCEELLFRGALQRALGAALARGAGPVVGGIVAVAISTVAFVLLHTVPYGGAVPPSAVLSPLLVGLGAGALVAATGRLAPGIVAHVLFNLGGVLLLLW
ncbi:CPBP family intramembrane metalloprotease [Microbacterium sp. W1N]|uniref:CPBP family intramembrane glutamic endopeptidase n=1 Tax=Microbacterium festucae TaxID=2977531 RepID=UPI0021C23DE5|nr:CPBP family intramembrane glutamic endopeptidase [Microbacterium festucae]MCT9819020.1 CPBP family intramembrane metalloprotease [Microbacterium festucae]